MAWLARTGIIQEWWGNTVYMNTADYTAVPLTSLPEGENFSPSSW